MCTECNMRVCKYWAKPSKDSEVAPQKDRDGVILYGWTLGSNGIHWF